MVLKRLRRYRNLYEKSEESVKYQIINPILKELGWNSENPEEVRINISTEEDIPDYTLLKNNKKVLFTEAKKLSVDKLYRMSWTTPIKNLTKVEF